MSELGSASGKPFKFRASAPYRISLGGGGSDLPAYAAHSGGFIVAATTRARLEVTVQSRAAGFLVELDGFAPERVANASEIKHPIVREAVLCLAPEARGLSLSSRNGLPPNSGLGSSSSFTVSVCAALLHWQRQVLAKVSANEPGGRSARTLGQLDPAKLSGLANHIECERLGRTMGRQDATMAAHGGLRALTFLPGGEVQVEPIRISSSDADDFAARLLVFDTLQRRQAEEVLSKQSGRLETPDSEATAGMHRIKEMGYAVRDLLEDGDFDRYGLLLDEHWRQKRAQSGGISNPTLDAHYAAALAAGAEGGKIMGAGGGGFFLFYVPPPRQAELTEALEARGLRAQPFGFSSSGCSVKLVG